MRYRTRCAKISVKVLVIVMLVTVALGMSLFAARQVRRSILSKMSLTAGQAALESKDWQAVVRNFMEYLGRNPDDVDILKKYAKARLSIRPLDAANVAQAIAAYRRVIQLTPLDKVAYDQLAMLYSGIGDFDELAYIARARLEHVPNDPNAPLSLAEALIQLKKGEEAQQTLLKFIKELEALPDKRAEYVRACGLMSNIAGSDGSPGAKAKALEWLNKAVTYAPQSIEALANRARFYRVTPGIPGLSDENRPALARKVLEAADDLGTEDPRIRLFLGIEWMLHGELDRAAAELHAAESLPQETLEEHFFNIDEWNVARFLFTLELAMRKGAATQGASVADESLKVLTEKRHRVQVLPSAVAIYVAAGKVSEARRCLDEYLNTPQLEETAESRLRLAYLRALVAQAEEKPYVVIDALQPVVVNDASRPELWRLLAAAYSRTGQTRRAVSALVTYLSLRPGDPQMTQQLAAEYSKLADWSKASETARAAESLNVTDIALKLLRIGANINLAVGQGQSINTAKLEESSAELAQLRREHSDRADIRIFQAIIAVYRGQPDEAERELKLAIEECKEPLKAEMQLAGHYARTKRTAEAVTVCQTACKRHAEVAEPWLSLSDLHVSNADYDSARSCLKQGLDAVTGKQEKRSLSIGLASLELIHGDRATGIRLLSELAAQDEQEVQTRVLLLGVREIQEDPAVAGKLVGELRQIEGETGLWWRVHQASLHLSSDEWRSKQQDIVDLLQYCMDADPRWSAPVLLLVGMYERLQDFRRVEDTCRQALVRNPSAVDIADKLLTLLERQGRFADAEKVLQQTETNPQVASAWQVRMALRAEDYSRAIDELKVRASNNDQDASSRIQLARLVYQQTKDADQAFRYLKEAEAITPKARTLTAVKASILRAEGRAEEAQRILDAYVADTNDFTAYWMRAVYLAEQGDFERAEKDYRKLTTFAEGGAAGYGLLSDFYAGNKQLDKAVATLEEGLNAYPADLRLKRRLMQQLFLRAHAEDRKRALEILASLEGQLPQDPELMTRRAMQMLEESTPQSLKAAREKLENVIKLEPTAVDAHLALIGIAMQDGQYESARDYAIRALGSNPNNSALLSARARAELALENTQMAVKLAHLVLQNDPNNADALGVLADAAIGSEDRNLVEEARKLIESAVGSNPQNERLLLLRAHVLASLKLPRTAIPELEAYCRTKDGGSSVAALVTLADLYRLSGDAGQAELKIEQAERIDPGNQAVIHGRFLLLVSQKRFEELAKISSAYFSAKKQNPTLILRAASTLSASDSMSLKKEGVRLFEHAVTLLPTSIDARFGLASSLYQTGNADRAKNIYEELLEQHPRDVRILNDLAWVLQEHYRRYADALTLANKGLSIAPDDLHLLDTRGTILSNIADRLADAKKDFERLVELSPSDSRQRAKALIQLGRVCARLNDFVQARGHLEKALEIDRKMDVLTPDERAEVTKLIQQSGI